MDSGEIGYFNFRAVFAAFIASVMALFVFLKFLLARMDKIAETAIWAAPARPGMSISFIIFPPPFLDDLSRYLIDEGLHPFCPLFYTHRLCLVNF